MNKKKGFPSKILLFGEYSIINKSMALSIPYSLFEGHLTFPKNKESSKDSELDSLAKYLRRLESKAQLGFKIDISSFEFDISQGLYFNSTIPHGFGVGSSAALTAAIYYRYGDNNDDILQLKKNLSIIESHFHSSSSGIDPLISYLNKTMIVNEDQGLEEIKIPEENKDNDGAMFLLNTGRSRKTEPLVNLFLEKCNNKSFLYVSKNQLNPITNTCIKLFINNDFNNLYKYFRDLSEFQLKYLNPMIPNLYQDIWRQGLCEHHYYLKLCGAGGGGFLMGMTFNFSSTAKLLKNYNLRPIYRF